MKSPLRCSIYVLVLLLQLTGMNNPALAATELSERIISELKSGNQQSMATFETDNITVVYIPDPFTGGGDCQVLINYFNGTKIVTDSHPRTRMIYQVSSKGEAIVIANTKSKAGGTVRVKGNNDGRIVTLDKSINMGGELGNMQVTKNGMASFNDLRDIMLSSSEIIVDSGMFMGSRLLGTFKMHDFSDAYSATSTLCSRQL